jgi:hypothetical protein
MAAQCVASRAVLSSTELVSNNDSKVNPVSGREEPQICFREVRTSSIYNKVKLSP